MIFAIVFAETGLVLAPFLPGDSLLFAAGALAGAQRLELWAVAVVVLTAAVAGDAVNYFVGRFFGDRIAGRAGRLVKRRHIEATQRVLRSDMGARRVVLARFVPVARTFAPFVAGLGGMTLGRFWRYNILGAVAWVALFVVSGYFFGTIPWVESNLTIVILAIVGVSVVPLALKAGRHRWGSERVINNTRRKEGSMDCPVCGERLKEIERSGVMVDICPSCKGVWLDRGEIDKLIETESQRGHGRPLRPGARRPLRPESGTIVTMTITTTMMTTSDRDDRDELWRRLRVGKSSGEDLAPAGHPRRLRRRLRPDSADDPSGLSPAEAGERLQLGRVQRTSVGQEPRARWRSRSA